MSEEGLVAQLKRLVVGEPIPSHLAHHERLSRLTGLAVRLVGASFGQVIVLSDAENLVSSAGDVPPTARRPAEPSLARSTVTAGRTTVTPDSDGLGASLRDGEKKPIPPGWR